MICNEKSIGIKLGLLHSLRQCLNVLLLLIECIPQAPASFMRNEEITLQSSAVLILMSVKHIYNHFQYVSQTLLMLIKH